MIAAAVFGLAQTHRFLAANPKTKVIPDALSRGAWRQTVLALCVSHFYGPQQSQGFRTAGQKRQ
jgi:hypothetical protein